jgi:hypothetical protein
MEEVIVNDELIFYFSIIGRFLESIEEEPYELPYEEPENSGGILNLISSFVYGVIESVKSQRNYISFILENQEEDIDLMLSFIAMNGLE